MFLDFYELREQPFGVTPDPQYVYAAPRYRQALASLLSTVENDLGFAAMVAAPGLGKTTLLFQLLEALRAAARTAFIFQTLCGPDELLRHILLELDLRVGQADAAQLHVAFNDFLVVQTRACQRVVIVLDEAQNLPEASLEFVRLLTNFETPCRKLLTVVLSGQPQLAEKLSDPALAQLGQRIATVAHLLPFNPAEVAEYVKYRLRVAGHRSGNLFDEEALGEIAALTSGVPRMINRACFNALSLGCALGRKKISREIVGEAVADLDFRLLKDAAPATAGAGIPVFPSRGIARASAAMLPPVTTAPASASAMTASKAYARPVPAGLHPGSERPVRRQQPAVPHPPMLGWETQSTWRSETRRQFVLTATVMLIIAIGGLVWFSAGRLARQTTPASQQSTLGSVQSSSSGRSAQAATPTEAKHPRPRPGIRAKRIATEATAQGETQPMPTATSMPPAADQRTVSKVTMRVGEATPILESTTAPWSVLPATLRQAPRPLYPDSARQLGVGGRVVVEATIDKDGQVSDVEMVEGNPQFRDAAEEAVRQWVYSPSQVDGQAVSSKATIEFYFHSRRTRRDQALDLLQRGPQ